MRHGNLFGGARDEFSRGKDVETESEINIKKVVGARETEREARLTDSQISRNVLHLIRQQCVVASGILVNYIGHETMGCRCSVGGVASRQMGTKPEVIVGFY